MQYNDYLAALKEPFIKLARLRFLQPDGTTAFAVDNCQYNKKSVAFISDGTISMKWGNGRRRSADVTLANLDGEFDYNVNQVWFGTEIALDEGLILPDGTEFYLPQGVFLVESPEEKIEPAKRTISYHLVDKVANLDGGLSGIFDTWWQIGDNEDIFPAITALLLTDKGNGCPLDNKQPIYTTWYNGKTKLMPNGTERPMTYTSYEFRVEAGGTAWDFISGVCDMISAWVGYDESGALRVDPSQDDILDIGKPIAWRFSMEDTTLLGASYTSKNTEVYNDFIAVGETLSSNRQAAGRAQNYDPSSDTNINTIGRKTKYFQHVMFGADEECVDYADWHLKRVSILQKAVSISCSQIFHIVGNDIVEITRTDKPGNPTERHLVTGFSRPLAGNKPMTIDAVSTQDIAIATLTKAGDIL